MENLNVKIRKRYFDYEIPKVSATIFYYDTEYQKEISESF